MHPWTQGAKEMGEMELLLVGQPL